MHRSYTGDMGSYRLYGFSTTLQSSIVGLISRKTGERMVRRGLVEEGVDLDGATPCFRKLQPERGAKKSVPVVEFAIDSDESSAAFSQAEVMAIAGTGFRNGRSRTARMTDEQRAARVNLRTGRKLPAEDIVEKATNKFTQWNKIGNLLSEVMTVERVCLS